MNGMMSEYIRPSEALKLI
jgi:hypothetical protein